MEASKKTRDPLLSTVQQHIKRVFRDQNGNLHIVVQRGESTAIFDLPSKDFERWVRRTLIHINGMTHTSAEIERVITYIEALADDPETEVRPYFSRIGQIDKTLYYDLGNNKVVKINANERCIIDNRELEVCFSPVAPQVEPDFSVPPQRLPKLLSSFRLKNPADHILLIAFLITAFIHDINHPLMILYGAAGSSKSTTASRIGQIIDPQSTSNRLTMNPDRKAMIAALSHRYYLNFDNLDCSLRKWQSDLLCNACTGGAEPMRKLYETNSLYTAPIKGVVCLNGLEVSATEADLLDRSILIELERIDSDSYIPEEDLNRQFQAALPSILGAIFNTLHQALKMEETALHYPRARMQDFAKYAYLICEAISGEWGSAFALQYKVNIEQARCEAKPPILVSCLSSFMQNTQVWTGNMTQLSEALLPIAKKQGYRQSEYPQSPSAFARQLNYTKNELSRIGITYTQQVGGKRILEILNSQFEASDFT